MNLENFTAIYRNKKVVGYVSSASIEYKKTVTKTVTILDLNADELFSIDIENAKNTYFVESSFNGEEYGLLFIDIPASNLMLKLYDKQGNYKYEVHKILKGADISYFTSHISRNNSYTGFNQYLHEIGKDGFILMYNSIENNSNNCQIYRITSGDTSREIVYTYKIESPIYDAKFLGASAHQLYFSFEKNGKKSHQYYADIIGLEKTKLESIYEITQNESQDYYFFPKIALTDDTSDYIKLVGYYFNSDKNMDAEFYDGYAYWELEPKGDFKNEKYISFQKDILDLKFNRDNKGKEFGYLLFQNAFKTKDDKIYIISEGYKKVADGRAISTSFMGVGSYSDYTRVRTFDIALSEFDLSFNYQKTTIIDKQNNSIQLGFYTQQPIFELGKIFNQYGLFDYINTEVSDDNSFSILYKDYNVNASSGVNYKIGKYSKAGNLVSISRIEKLPNTNDTYFMPNVNGRVLFVEWIKKKIYFEFKK